MVIPEEAQDKQLAEELRGEAAGILNWLVGGCLRWQRDGMPAPSCVEQATSEYRLEQDVLGPFLEERCVFGQE